MNREPLLNELDSQGIKYCFNEAVYDYSKLKFIIVGDNPGKTEYLENRFFIGPSGQELRRHFSEKELCSNFDEECIIFNKTFIHTTRTIELEPIQKQVGDEIFSSIQKLCASEIAEIANKYQIPILVFGKSNIGNGLLFESFWEYINSELTDSSKLLVFNHPSPPYLQFQKEWNKFEATLSFDSNLDLLYKIGQINTAKINTHFIRPYKPVKTMNIRFFYASNAHNTWPKIFVLTEDGKFYSEYLNFMKPAVVNEKFEFISFKAEDYKWGGYQAIVEIDEKVAKSKVLKRQVNWVERYLNSLHKN
jgi:hypothetical protein